MEQLPDFLFLFRAHISGQHKNIPVRLYPVRFFLFFPQFLPAKGAFIGPSLCLHDNAFPIRGDASGVHSLIRPFPERFQAYFFPHLYHISGKFLEFHRLQQMVEIVILHAAASFPASVVSSLTLRFY